MDDKTTPNMTPSIAGPELYSFADHKLTIYEGSGFDSNNPQHERADTVRHGIAIQEARTSGDYALADKRADWMRGFGYGVSTGPGFTVISNGGRMVEVGGVIFDSIGPDPSKGEYLLYEI